MGKLIRSYTPPEALLWIAGLVYLACVNPYTDGHMTLCIFRALGIDWCLGCGLGRSVALMFHGEVVGSIQTHPLGIPALVVLTVRIITLLLRAVKQPSFRAALVNRGG